MRFAIVNSIAYLHEWKESLNYLKQKYAESELKCDNIIEKYQTCIMKERNNLQNNSLILENKIKKLLKENQTLSEERFFHN